MKGTSMTKGELSSRPREQPMQKTLGLGKKQKKSVAFEEQREGHACEGGESDRRHTGPTVTIKNLDVTLSQKEASGGLFSVGKSQTRARLLLPGFLNPAEVQAPDAGRKGEEESTRMRKCFRREPVMSCRRRSHNKPAALTETSVFLELFP